MIALLALAATCSTNAYYSRQLPQQELAQCYLSRLSPYPELVEFRGVRESDGYVCGEVSTPWGKSMSGFRPFVFRDDENWVQVTPDGISGRNNGRGEASALYDATISHERRKGNSISAVAEWRRKQAFEAKARVLLGACAAHLDAE